MNFDLLTDRVAAERVRRSYAEAVEAIRSDGELSTDGRTRRLASLWASTRAELDRLAASDRNRLAHRKADLEKQLFVPHRPAWQDQASFAISMRDASDRAVQLSRPDEALELLQRAERNGDDVLARAIVQHSLDRNGSGIREADNAWSKVAGTYLDNHHSLEAVVKELAAIETLTGRQIISPFSLPAPHGLTPQQLNSATTDEQRTAPAA